MGKRKFSKMGPGGGDLVSEANLWRIEFRLQSVKRMKIYKSQLIAANEADERLVTEFLAAENRNDVEKQKAMKDVIANSVKPDAVKLVDAFLDGDVYRNSDDPKAWADALLALANPVGGYCYGDGFGIVNGEDDKAKNL